MRLFGKKPVPQVPDLFNVLLQLKIAGEDSNYTSLEILLDRLWEILRATSRSKFSGHLSDHFSLEIRSRGGRLEFYIWLPFEHRPAVEKAIFAVFPNSEVKEVIGDYSRPIRSANVVCSGELELIANELLPIFSPSHHINHWPAIRLALSEPGRRGEEKWLQLLLRPMSDQWKAKADRSLRLPQDGRFSDVQIRQLVDEKVRGSGFRAKIRLVCLGSDQRSARQSLELVGAAFVNFNNTNPNGFRLKAINLDPDRQLEYYTRLFIDKGMLLTPREIACLYSFSSIDSVHRATQSTVPAAKSLSRFEKLLAQAQQHPIVKKLEPLKPINQTAGLTAASSRSRTPKGILRLTTKALSRRDVGKVATKRVRPSQ